MASQTEEFYMKLIDKLFQLLSFKLLTTMKTLTNMPGYTMDTDISSKNNQWTEHFFKACKMLHEIEAKKNKEQPKFI